LRKIPIIYLLLSTYEITLRGSSLRNQQRRIKKAKSHPPRLFNSAADHLQLDWIRTM